MKTTKPDDSRIETYLHIDKVLVNKIYKLNSLNAYKLFFLLLSKQSFKSGLIGVFNEVTAYSLRKELDISTKSLKLVLNLLKKNNILNVFHESPMIIQLHTRSSVQRFNDLQEIVKYVKLNEQEFYFDRTGNINRRDRFYKDLSLDVLAIENIAPAMYDKLDKDGNLIIVDNDIQNMNEKALFSKEEQEEQDEIDKLFGSWKVKENNNG